MDQARGKPPTPAQNSTTFPVADNPPKLTVHPTDEGVLKAAPSVKGRSHSEQDAFQTLLTTAGIRTNTSPTFPSTTRTRAKGRGRIQRRLDRFEWMCFDDKCNRLDALSCSSTLVSFFTRFQVSCADISPSCSHLMLDNSAGDIKGGRGDST